MKYEIKVLFMHYLKGAGTRLRCTKLGQSSFYKQN